MGRVLGVGVITGGPCGGKTTAKSAAQQWGSDHGIRVLFMPETATITIMAGIPDIGDIARNRPDQYYMLEKSMFHLQRHFRKYANYLAQCFEEDVLILFDRAEMDISSYMTEPDFETLLAETGLTYHDVRDSYDFVIHLVTAADGAAEHYSSDNNEARYETVDEAIESDRRTLGAWVGHPHLHIIDNSTDFEGKIGRVIRILEKQVGAPVEIERKFLVESPDLTHPVLASARKVQIEQTYLGTDDPSEELRVRKRTVEGSTTYYLTQKKRLSGGTKEERERTITAREYAQLIRTRDPERKTISKTRYCFPNGSTYCELDVFQNPKNLAILEVELYEEGLEVNLPNFLGEAREVTDALEYHNSELART